MEYAMQYGIAFFLQSVFALLISQYAYGQTSDKVSFYSSSSAVIAQFENHQVESATTGVYLMLFDAIGQTPKVQLLPVPRIEREFEGAGSVCTFARLKNQARERFLFSEPVAAFLSPRLYQQKTSQPIAPSLLNSKGKVQSLADVFNSGQYGSLLMIDGRSYGDYLDQQIEHIDSGYKHYRYGADRSSKDVRMLLMGRAEFVLAYPGGIYSEQQRLNAPELRSYAVAGVPDYVVAHTMCNDRPGSRSYLQRLNQGLAKLYQDPAYAEVQLRFVADANRDELHQALVAEGMASEQNFVQAR